MYFHEKKMTFEALYYEVDKRKKLVCTVWKFKYFPLTFFVKISWQLICRYLFENWVNLISRKIWVTEKFPIFYAVLKPQSTKEDFFFFEEFANVWATKNICSSSFGFSKYFVPTFRLFLELFCSLSFWNFFNRSSSPNNWH